MQKLIKVLTAAVIALVASVTTPVALAQTSSESGIAVFHRIHAAFPAISVDSISLAAEKAVIFAQINAYRAQHGLAPVAYSQEWANQAQDWANYLNSQGGHHTWHQSDINAFEVIARTAWTDINAPVQQWKESPTHNSVLLSPNLGVGGVGLVQNNLGQYIAVFRGFF
ncbi:putative secreted protein [Corynebacterium kutscheri]|uniref:Secreted protein n=1 Tax=Corynebacterium kutscheri TaxID=35755 RepID=A0A0F6TCY1_9CORY|nr:CAP domain-containing protein [Corynebacterium kutscheri]AKE41254.1 hypothetical protein UL82_05395 [Corynebacterium kutscheri]VEH08530.1 putative secreted protein [Corynebacterium kutscheri]VEH09576.1 putative secreted protein [Corynebacterium kutscheri]VEH79659.1 putative secreted protein [Corynebacterium kutscheri]